MQIFSRSAAPPDFPTYYIIMQKLADPDAADRDAAKKVCVVLFGFPARNFPTYYIFPLKWLNRDAADNDAADRDAACRDAACRDAADHGPAEKVCVVLFGFLETSIRAKVARFPQEL